MAKTARRDWSYDQIGRRLSYSGPAKTLEAKLASDDARRVKWILEQVLNHSTVIDIGCSDGTIARRCWELGHQVLAIERHPRQWPNLRGLWVYGGEAVSALLALPTILAPVTVLCTELFEHLTEAKGEKILLTIPPAATLIVTVPNRESKSSDRIGRGRWDWPDHQRHFTAETLRTWLQACGWRPKVVLPLCGSWHDSIWLGAVCHRR